MNTKRKQPQCINRYCYTYQMLAAFSTRQSTAPEVARRIGISIQQAENAANRLRVRGYVEHIPDEGYYVTELGHQALFNTPHIYAPTKMAVRFGRTKLIRRLEAVKCGPERRTVIKDILKRLESEYRPVYSQARKDALAILLDKKTIKLSKSDVEAALRLWLKQRYKVESDLVVEFTGDEENPLEVTSVFTDKR